MDQPSNPDRGALNGMTRQTTLEALRLARTGQVYDLGVDLGNDLPRLPPNQIAPFNLSQYRTPGSFAGDAALRGNSFSVEIISGSLHQSAHIDALIHAQRHGRVYGGGAVSYTHLTLPTILLV